MKANIEVAYYRDGNGEYEVHLQELFSEYHIMTHNIKVQTSEFELNHEWKPNIKIPDFTLMSEEEVFQASLLWDAPYSIYFILSAQKYIKDNINKWKGYSVFETTLEY